MWREWYEKNRDHRQAYQRQRRLDNIEVVRSRESARRSSPAYREEARMRTAAWVAQNHERHLAASRAWYKAHGAEQNDRRREEKRAYYLANKERMRESSRRWTESNRERARHYCQTWSARRRGNGGSHTIEEWRDLCVRHGHRCAYCGAQKRLERDHVVPLSRGGTNSIDNILPACRSCNARKNAKTADEFRAALKVA